MVVGWPVTTCFACARTCQLPSDRSQLSLLRYAKLRSFSLATLYLVERNPQSGTSGCDFLGRIIGDLICC